MQPISTSRSPFRASKPVVSVSSTTSRIEQSLRTFEQFRVDRFKSKMPAIESAGKSGNEFRVAGRQAAGDDRRRREILHLGMAKKIGDQRRCDAGRLT